MTAPETCQRVMGDGMTHWYCGKPFLRAEDGSCDYEYLDGAWCGLTSKVCIQHRIPVVGHAYLPPLTNTCEAGPEREDGTK